MIEIAPKRPRLSRRVLLVIGVVAAVLVLAAVTGATSSPRACSSCHAMEPFVTSWASSTHSQIGCYRCHLDNGAWDWPAFKGKELFEMVPAAVAGQGLQGPTTEISSKTCLSCHSAVMNGVIEANETRINHSTCIPSGAQCDSCHSAVVHGAATRWVRQPVMEECVRCHREESAPTECDTCHVGRRESDRLAMGPWQVTHGSEWRTTHGAADLTYCSTCHPQDYCVKCHGIALPHPADFGRTHGQQAVAQQSKCVKCHDKKTLCDGCHGIAMPHPTGFIKQHSTLATSNQDPTCQTCHRVDDCNNCHLHHIHPGRTDGTIGEGNGGVIGKIEAD